MQDERKPQPTSETGATETVAAKPLRCPLPRWARWAGLGAFVFFLLKGLAWLVVPMRLIWWRS